MSTETLPDFGGKLVLFYVGGDYQHPLPIGGPRFVEKGGRLFLVGQSPTGGSAVDWMAGAEVAVSWDSVVQYVVFADEESYRERMQSLDGGKGLLGLFR